MRIGVLDYPLGHHQARSDGCDWSLGAVRVQMGGAKRISQVRRGKMRSVGTVVSARAFGTELQLDLASHLRSVGWLTFTEIEIPGTEGDSYASGRVDVAAIKPHHYAQRDLRAYECKSSRRDFLHDVGSDKWRRYLLVFPRVYFAVPAGLIKKSEVPKEAGLIVRGDKGWTTVKAAKGHIPPNLSVNSILALLYRGYEHDKEVRDVRDRLIFDDRGAVKTAKAFGWDTRRKLSQTVHELDPTLRALKEVIEGITGQTLTGIATESLTRQVEAALILSGEVKEHGQAMRHIISYLQSLTSTYTTEERRVQARGKVEAI